MIAASLVPTAIPPNDPLDGVDLIKVLSFFEISLILVLSPRMEPPVKFDDGSIAKTPNLKFLFTKNVPKDSIKVDLPTPGGPENPTLIACPGDLIS